MANNNERWNTLHHIKALRLEQHWRNCIYNPNFTLVTQSQPFEYPLQQVGGQPGDENIVTYAANRTERRQQVTHWRVVHIPEANELWAEVD